MGRSSVIAAVFGLIYVLVNTGPPPTAVALALRVPAAMVFVAVLVALYRGRHRSVEDPPDRNMMGRTSAARTG